MFHQAGFWIHTGSDKVSTFLTGLHFLNIINDIKSGVTHGIRRPPAFRCLHACRGGRKRQLRQGSRCAWPFSLRRQP